MFLFWKAGRLCSRLQAKTLGRVTIEMRDSVSGTNKLITLLRTTRQKIDIGDTGVSHVKGATVTILSLILMMPQSVGKSPKWLLDLCCSKHMSNNRASLFFFKDCEGAVQFDINEVITSYEVDFVLIDTLVGV